MTRRPRRSGFTLIEMLVVIAIIVVLVAILFPVFSKVRAKARKTKCLAHMHELALALKQYRNDVGKYPELPYYDTTDGRYKGGLSALYPDYIDSTEVLVCPDDPIGKSLAGPAKDVVYSSYNGAPTDAAGGDWTLTEIWYNYDGYDMTIGAGGEIISTGIDNLAVDEATYKAVMEAALATKGLRWTARPRLENRSAPDNTIITHCTHHRKSSGGEVNEESDHIVRLGGDSDNVKRTQMEKDPDGSGPLVPLWLSQFN